MSDELDAGTRADGAPAGAGADGANGERVYVCSLLNDAGEVCGETFTGERASIDKANHTRRDHPNHRNTERKRGAKRAAEPKPDKAPSGQRAPRRPAAPSRAEQYQHGLATLATLAFIAPGPFDAFDCQCVTAGAPTLAPPLAELAERNPAVRSVLDTILGGGPAGPYAALVIAALSIAAPIAAHHGLIPTSAGSTMGAMIGVTVPAPPAPPSPPSDGITPPDVAPAAGIDPNNVDDVTAFLANVPPHVAADAAMRLAPPGMLGEDRPVVVGAPLGLVPDGATQPAAATA